jgi:chromosome partitioning protein
LAPASISNRISYANAMGTGSSATLSDKTAEEEISKVWMFIKSLILEKERPEKEKLNL